MNTLLRKQLLGGAGAAPAVALVLLAWAYAPQLLQDIPLPDDDPGSRLGFVARWLLVPGWMLLAGVFGASRRGFFADAIEGTRTPAAPTLEINLRYNQNTIEQAILASIAWAGLAVALPHDDLTLIPGMAVLFAVGRVTFWAGYIVHPMARTFGMTLTVVPTIIAFLALTWMALT
ncbi:MAG: MAPEG family protein [Alphaproteobacteria bacterium]|nr:MAPEG family protein [Alphaproteobacteria bacterium]